MFTNPRAICLVIFIYRPTCFGFLPCKETKRKITVWKAREFVCVCVCVLYARAHTWTCVRFCVVWQVFMKIVWTLYNQKLKYWTGFHKKLLWTWYGQRSNYFIIIFTKMSIYLRHRSFNYFSGVCENYYEPNTVEGWIIEKGFAKVSVNLIPSEVELCDRFSQQAVRTWYRYMAFLIYCNQYSPLYYRVYS
jgi:hypothetical protein